MGRAGGKEKSLSIVWDRAEKKRSFKSFNLSEKHELAKNPTGGSRTESRNCSEQVVMERDKRRR